jgi:hypothetical protein
MAGSTTAYRNADATVSSYDARAVTTSDTTNIAPTRGLYIGGAGNVVVDMAYGTTITFVAVQGGTILPIQVTRIYATGTSATSIVALY